MFKHIMILLLLPLSLFSQYWGERVTEESFEQSDLYFTSHYLNPFGLYRFREVSLGLTHDPFLELQVNPANLPSLPKNRLIYLDFRGDRTEPVIVQQVYPLLTYAPQYIDPRWYNQTRRDPEPMFSAGLLTFPFSGKLKNLFLGGTFQLMHKQEQFYSVPSWIYNYRYGYDVFGAATNSNVSIPIEDRYRGEDEMLINGNLYSAFAGYRLSEKLTIGASFNGVAHSREGSYLNLRNDEYGNTDDSDWGYLTQRGRDQKYHHMDIAGGLDYRFTSDFSAGIKAGILSGKADQDYLSVDSSHYIYNQPNITPDWSYSISRSTTNQKWENQGESRYAGFNFTNRLESGQVLNFYYQFTRNDIDLTNSSGILDSSFYSYRWQGDTTYHLSTGEYSLADVRRGTGKRKKNAHEGMISMFWNLSPKTTLTAGVYYARRKTEITSSEPVFANRNSHYISSGYYPQEYEYMLREDKTLDWRYQSVDWSLQIPVLLHFKFNSTWGMTLGINRILNNWDIREQTTAYFSIRQRLENGVIKSETNFGERYTEPRRRITEDFTDVIARWEVNISPQFQVQLLLDPEFENSFRIAQWWLAFRTSL